MSFPVKDLGHILVTLGKLQGFDWPLPPFQRDKSERPLNKQAALRFCAWSRRERATTDSKGRTEVDLLFDFPIRFRRDQRNEGLKLDGTSKTSSEEGIY